MKSNHKVTKFFAGAFLAVVAASAQADIKYTQQTTISGNEAGPGASTMTRMVHPGAERTEMVISLGKVKMNYLTLSICEPKQEIKLDPDNKIYTIVTPYDQKKPQNGAANTGTDDNKEPKTGKVISTYAVQDLGEEVVAGFKTRHYKITTTLESSGCAGDGTTTSTVEYWIADIKDAIPCKATNTSGTYEIPQFNPGCKISYETKSDVTAYQKIFTGLIMRTRTYDGAKVLATTEITQLSQAKLEDSVFAIPADYKKVSEEEFQKVQSAAMMKAMMSGQMPVE